MSRYMHPMEAARAIAAEMYTAAIQREIATPCEPTPEPDRASLLAAEILDAPVMTWTREEMLAYLRTRPVFAGFPPSAHECDHVLMNLHFCGSLTVRNGHYMRTGKATL